MTKKSKKMDSKIDSKELIKHVEMKAFLNVIKTLPGIGIMSFPRCRSHAKANCEGVHACLEPKSSSLL